MSSTESKEEKTPANSEPNPNQQGNDGGAKKEKPGISVTVVAVVAAVVGILASVSGHWHDGWMQFGALPVGLLAVAFWIYEYVHWKFSTRTALISSLVFLVFSGSLAFILYRINPGAPEPAPSFSVTSKATLFTDTRSLHTMFRMISSHPLKGTVICPVHQVSQVQLTSLKQQSVMIDSYYFEAQISPGKWVLAPAIDPHGGVLLTVHSPTNATPTQFESGTLQSALMRKSIAPGETVQGAILLEMPEAGFGDELRIQILDTVGNRYVEVVRPQKSDRSTYQDAQPFRWMSDIEAPPIDTTKFPHEFHSKIYSY